MTDWRPLCLMCEKQPHTQDDVLCASCRAKVDVDSMVVTDPLELLLSHHLPLAFPNGRTMCLCHSDSSFAVFDGPVFHRQHVASLIYALMGLPGPTPHEPMMVYEAKRTEGEAE